MTRTRPSSTALPTRLAVIGAGAWGTMLAILLARNGHHTTLWARHDTFAQTLHLSRENTAYLPGATFPPLLSVNSDLKQAVQDVEAAVCAVPSKGLRDVMAKLPTVPALICATKGLELHTMQRFSEVLQTYQPHASIAALSGPNLASEIALDLPATATVASYDDALARNAQLWLHQATFRVYRSRDIIGVELGGALKNIIALAAGMCDGLALGDNTKASIITRGLAEMVRLSTHLGAKPETLYGLAGLGDMIATCSSSRSRNHTAGERFAQGISYETLKASGMTTEGIPTCQAVVGYAAKHGLELPIASEVYQVIFEAKSPKQALLDLMLRDTKPE